MNKMDKPKMTSMELVKKLRDEKGVTFKYISEEEAEKYLTEVNNYLRTASYRKNYQKHQLGESKGKYIDLDFKYLQELSTIDFHLRNHVTMMCIDIEHDLKVRFLKDLETDQAEDGYSIVDNFLNVNARIVSKIEAASSSPFTGNLVNKYFDLQQVPNSHNGRLENKIVSFDCPAWVLVELMSFGDFIRFYEYYYRNKGSMPVSIEMINLVKNLRNGCAHNSCILANLCAGASTAPAELYRRIAKITGIKSNMRQKKLSCRAVLEFVSMLVIYEEVVSKNVKKHRVRDLKKLLYGRVRLNKHFFEKNPLLTTTYVFVIKVIRDIFG